MIKISEIINVGDKFNDFTVVNNDPVIIDRRQQILVKCNCGKEYYIRPDRLITNKTKRCWSCAGLEKKGKMTSFVGELSSRFFLDIKSNAKIRNLEWNMTMQDLWNLFKEQQAKCALSGLPIKLVKLVGNERDSIRKQITASLDRIDSSKGYTMDNVQWVHKWINVMKGAMSDQQFIFICNKVSENNNFEYDNIEPSLMTGWLPRMFNRRGDRSKEGVTTSSLSEPSNNENQEPPISNLDKEIV